jgi:hypothetical protein
MLKWQTSQPSPPLTRGERAGSGGILHAQEFVNSGSAIGIMGVKIDPIFEHSRYSLTNDPEMG